MIFSDINFTDIGGYNIFDPANGLQSIGDLNVGESIQSVPDQPVIESVQRVQVEGGLGGGC